MLRSVSLLLLVCIALPYARSPLCQVDAHAHDHGDVLVAVDAQGEGGDGADCHALMGCQVASQASVIAAATRTYECQASRAAKGESAKRRADTPRPPLPPPPKSI